MEQQRPMILSRFRLVLFVSLVIVMGPRLAYGKQIAVLEMRWAGAPPALRQQVRASINRALAELGHHIVPVSRAKIVELVPGCSSGPCLSAAGKKIRADLGFFGGIATLGSSYDMTFSLVDLPSGTQLGQTSVRCDICTFAEAGKRAASAVKELNRQAEAFETSVARVTIDSTPIPVDVFVDGVPAGRTPLQRLIDAGQHTIETQSDTGRKSQTTFVVHSGEKKTIRVHDGKIVDGSASDPIEGGDGISMSWAHWTIVGLGASLSAAGATMWATSNNDNDLRTAGIALFSAGGAALVSLGVLLLADLFEGSNSHQRRSRLPSTGLIGFVPAPSGAHFIIHNEF